MTADVELLREAAENMRALACAATPGPWYEDNVDGVYAYGRAGEGCPAIFKTLFGTYADVQHTAAFGNPAVALAVADWLDEAAEASETDFHGQVTAHPLAVARAFLGRAEQ